MKSVFVVMGVFLVGCFICTPDSFKARLLRHMAQILALGINSFSGETFLQTENSIGLRQIAWSLLQER